MDDDMKKTSRPLGFGFALGSEMVDVLVGPKKVKFHVQ
jgi:hypothetical protein